MSKQIGVIFILLLLVSSLYAENPKCSEVDITCTGCIRTSLTILEIQNNYAKAFLVGQYSVTHAKIDDSCRVENPPTQCQELISLMCIADGEEVSFYYNDGNTSEFHPLGNCENVLTSSEGVAECQFRLDPGVYIIKVVYPGNVELSSAYSERTVRVGNTSVVGAVSQGVMNFISRIMISDPTPCVAAIFLGGALFASMFSSGIDPLRYFDIASPRIRKKNRYTASKSVKGYDQRKMRTNWGKLSSEIGPGLDKALRRLGISNVNIRQLFDETIREAVRNRWNKERTIEEIFRRIGPMTNDRRNVLLPLIEMYYAVRIAQVGSSISIKEQEPSRNKVVGFFTRRFRNLLEGAAGNIPITANVYFDAIRSTSRIIREFKRLVKVRLATPFQLTLGAVGFLGKKVKAKRATDFTNDVVTERANIAENSYKRQPHPIRDFINVLKDNKTNRKQKFARILAYLSYPGSKESAGSNLSSMLHLLDVVSLFEVRYNQWMREGYQSVYFYAITRIFKEKLGIDPADLAGIMNNLITTTKDGDLIINEDAISRLKANQLNVGKLAAIFILARYGNDFEFLKLVRYFVSNPNSVNRNNLKNKLNSLGIYISEDYFIDAYNHLKGRELIALSKITSAFRKAYMEAEREYVSGRIDSVDRITLEERLRAKYMLDLLNNILNDIRISSDLRIFFDRLEGIYNSNWHQALKARELYDFLRNNYFYTQGRNLFGSTGNDDFYHFLMEKAHSKSNMQFFFLKEYTAQLGYLVRSDNYNKYENKAELAALTIFTLKAINELFGLGSRYINQNLQGFLLGLMNSLRKEGSTKLDNYAQALQALFPQWDIAEMLKNGSLRLSTIFKKPIEGVISTVSSFEQGTYGKDRVGSIIRKGFVGSDVAGMDKNIFEVLRGDFRGIRQEAANDRLWAFDMRGHWKIEGSRLKVAAIETASRAYESPHRPGPNDVDSRLALIKEFFLENMLSVFARGELTSFGTNWRENFERADLRFFEALARYYGRATNNKDIKSAEDINNNNIKDFHNFLLTTRLNPLTTDQSTPWVMLRGISYVPYEKGMNLSIFDDIKGARLMFKNRFGELEPFDPSHKKLSDSNLSRLAQRLADAGFSNRQDALREAIQKITINKEGFMNEIRRMLDNNYISPMDVALLSFYLQQNGHHTGLLNILRDDEYEIVTLKKMTDKEAKMGGWEGMIGRTKQSGYGVLERVLARSIYLSSPRAEQLTDLLVSTSLLLYEGRKASAKMFEAMQHNAQDIRGYNLAGIYSLVLDRYMKFEGGWDYAITRDPRLHVPSMEGEERITHGYFPVGPALPYPSEQHWKTFQDYSEWKYSRGMLGRISKLATFIAKPFIMASRLTSYITGSYPSPKSLGYLTSENGQVIEPDTLQPFPYGEGPLMGGFRTVFNTIFGRSNWMTGPSLDPWYLTRRIYYWFLGEAESLATGSTGRGGRFKQWGYGGEEIIYGAPRPHQFVTPFYNPQVYNIWQAMANPGHSYFDSLGQYRLNQQILLWARMLYGARSDNEMNREGKTVFLPMSRELMHEANTPIYRREIPTQELLIKNRNELSYYSLTEGYINRLLVGGAIWNLSRDERKREDWKVSLQLGSTPAMLPLLPATSGVFAIYPLIKTVSGFGKYIRDEYKEKIRKEEIYIFCPRCGTRLNDRGECIYGHNLPQKS